MKTRFLISTLISILWVSSVLAQPNEQRFIGKAYDVDTGELLYQETHVIQQDENGVPVAGTVTYVQANGAPLAEKTLEYGKMPFAPSFQFKDQRIARDMAVTVETDRLVIQADGDESEVALPDDKPAVVDAGFNYFMQQNLSRLKQGDTLSLAFLAVGRAEFYSFEVSPEKQDEKQLVVKLAPASWVLSVLVDPIKLTYEQNTGQLLRYQGLGNIEQVKNAKGLDENYVVRIEYEYPE